MNTDCVCGHGKGHHIYEEGACRPGFVCPSRCEKYNLKEKPVEQESYPITKKVLVQIWLDGMTSGVASTVMNLGSVPTEAADRYAQKVVTSCIQNPGGIEVVWQQVQERIRGEDSGPKEMLVRLKPGEKP